MLSVYWLKLNLVR